MGPLFNLLSKIFSEEWISDTLSQQKSLVQPSFSPSEANHDTVYHIQQTLLIILEDITTSLKSTATIKAHFLFSMLVNLRYVTFYFVYLFAISLL